MQSLSDLGRKEDKTSTNRMMILEYNPDAEQDLTSNVQLGIHDLRDNILISVLQNISPLIQV